MFGNEVEKHSVSTVSDASMYYSKEDAFDVPIFLDKLEEAFAMFGHEVQKHSAATIFSDLSVCSKEDSRGIVCCDWRDTL